MRRHSGGLALRSYDSFLLRCWGLDSERPRIKLEHVQSGASTRVTTLAAAMAWISAHGRMGSTQPPAVPADGVVEAVDEQTR